MRHTSAGTNKYKNKRSKGADDEHGTEYN